MMSDSNMQKHELPADIVRTIEQNVANDLIQMIRRHKPLNEQEQRLMDSLIAEVGTKYQLLPPVEGFKTERIEEKLPPSGEWF